MSNNFPIFYSFRRCPYAIRARFAIRKARIKIELREILLQNKPKEFSDLSNNNTVPILVLSNSNIVQESIEIVKWMISYRYNNLLELFHKNEFLVKIIDKDFKENLDFYKYPNRYSNINPLFHRDKNISILKIIEKKLDKNNFLMSDDFSFLDYCIFPFIRQFRNVDPEWFENLEFYKINKWYSFIVESSEFNDIMKKYKVWKSSDVPIITNFKY